MIILVCMIGVIGGDEGSGSGASAPIMLLATEEEAYSYQYVGTELGAPWDIVLLADAIQAYDEGAGGMEDYNPLITALEFCVLMEKKYIAVPVEEPEETEESDIEDDENSDDSEDSSEDGENGEEVTQEKKEPEMEWELEKTVYYTGTEEILEYIDATENELTYEDSSRLVSMFNDVAESKSDSDTKYEVVMMNNSDYEDVLRNRIGIEEEHVGYIMELYESNYLTLLYGFTIRYDNIVLPDIVQGDCTRQDLANVAISIINHPYMMGGKSSSVGVPTGPLDCSGYVDWVYIQCFGVGVSGGSIPEGVAVSGTAQMWYACEAISSSELRVGDLGFVNDPATMRSGQVNHVGIYIGSYGGKQYWIHCGGSAYGTEDSPSGRVGISLSSGTNSFNPVTDSMFEPAMKGCRFRYYRRPQFEFVDG